MLWYEKRKYEFHGKLRETINNDFDLFSWNKLYRVNKVKIRSFNSFFFIKRRKSEFQSKCMSVCV